MDTLPVRRSLLVLSNHIHTHTRNTGYYKVEEKDGQLRRLDICSNGLVGINISVVDDFSFSGVTADFILAEGGYKASDAEEFGRAIREVQRDLAEFTP